MRFAASVFCFLSLAAAVVLAVGLSMKCTQCSELRELSLAQKSEILSLQKVRAKIVAREIKSGGEVLALQAANRSLRSQMETVAPVAGAQVEARVLRLPEDAGSWHTSLFVQPDWQKRPNEAAAVQMFNTRKWAIDLKARTHFHLITVNQPEARPYFCFVPQTPCLIIQEADGQIRYRESNPDLWKANHLLEFQINKTFRRQRHGNQPLCPGPNCPADKPDQEVPNEIIANPDQKEAPAPEAKPGLPMAVGIGIIVAAFGVSLLFFDVGGKTSRVIRAARSSR